MSCSHGHHCHFGVGGRRVGGSGGGRDREGERTPRRGCCFEELEKKRYRSEGAKKRAALKWCNKDESPPPSLRTYTPAWFRPPRYAYTGEGSSRRAPPSPASARSPLSSDWSSPSPPPAKVVGDADYAHDSDEERLAVEMLVRESELDREREIIHEREEARRSVELVNHSIAREEARITDVAVKEELADLIDLTNE